MSNPIFYSKEIQDVADDCKRIARRPTWRVEVCDAAALVWLKTLIWAKSNPQSNEVSTCQRLIRLFDDDDVASLVGVKRSRDARHGNKIV